MKNFPVLFACLVALAAPAAAETIAVAGSDTVLPIARKAAAAYTAQHPDVKFAIGGGGSSKGIRSVGAGEVELGMASRAMKAKEKKAHPSVVAHRIGVDGIALVVHKSNPVANLTTAQVRGLYSGAIQNWSEVGGEDSPVKLVTYHELHGTYGVFEKKVGLQGEARKGAGERQVVFRAEGGTTSGTALALNGAKPSLAAVLTKPNAIAYSALAAARELADKGAPLKVLSLDGVQPTKATLFDGSYTLQRGLYVLTKGAPTGTVAGFVKFLMGSEGQAIVAGQGSYPAAPAH